MVSVTPTPSTIEVRVADGITITRTPAGGFKFTVADGFNVVPVFSPVSSQIGYFISPVPPGGEPDSVKNTKKKK
jgi:hypothetical protein